MASAAVTSLTTARDNLIADLESQTAAWIAAGRPPTMSVDGESYDWGSWLKSQNEAIADLTKLIQSISSPFIVRSRGRA